MLINKINELAKLIGTQSADIKFASLVALGKSYSEMVKCLNDMIKEVK